MAHTDQQFRIVIQPQRIYRERYRSEQYRNGKRPPRFILAEDNDSKIRYPTIEIPESWQHINNKLYIRVTPVTIPKKRVRKVCVHPYPIDTMVSNVEKDSVSNALYFPITRSDFQNGRKAFCLTHTKLKQKTLKAHGPLRILNSNKTHQPDAWNKLDSKKLIKKYGLQKSRLVFSLFQYVDHNLNAVSSVSPVSSEVMFGTNNQQRSAVDAAVTATDHDRKLVSCAPEKGNRAGGDKVFMVLPELDTTAVEALRICFDFASLNQHIIVRHKLIDSKTIEFYTPACLLIPSDQDQMVPIIAIQNDKIIGRFDFVYQSSTIQPTADARLINLLNTSFDDVFPTTSNGPHDIDFGEIVSGLADYSG